jgi:flagellar protein FliO/FliZ
MLRLLSSWRALPILALSALQAPVFAQAAGNAPVPGVSSASFVQGFLGLVVVIGLLLVTLYALRRFGGRLTGANTAGMKVLSGLSVGARERILLIEVGDTWLVVGVTSSQVRTLHTMPKGSLPELESPTPVPFAAWLKQVTERRRHDA